MKEQIFNKKGTKQIINTGWKLFDKQTNLIDDGNCILNTQISSYIRPWCETECNGITRPEGHLMYYDLGHFRKYRIPPRIETLLQDKERRESVILYMFFTLNKRKKLEPFGWVVTSKDNAFITKQVIKRPNQRYDKRLAALNEAILYITK